MPKHLLSICHTSRLIGDFVPQILGSKFWALGGLNQKWKKKFCRQARGELTAKKWLDSIEKQKKKKQFEGASQTDIRTDRQSQSIVDNNDS